MFRLLKLKLVQQELRETGGTRMTGLGWWCDRPGVLGALAWGSYRFGTCTISKTPMKSKLCRRSSPRRLREAVTSSISGTIQP